jgi:hypothetical protein
MNESRRINVAAAEHQRCSGGFEHAADNRNPGPAQRWSAPLRPAHCKNTGGNDAAFPDTTFEAFASHECAEHPRVQGATPSS